MKQTPNIPELAAQQLRWPLRLTRAGIAAEYIVQSFWPLATVVLFILAALLFGLPENLSLELFWGSSVLAVVAFLGALVYGVRTVRWPSVGDALVRLDRTMPGRPIAAIIDQQAIGAGDAQSQAIWDTHVSRMTLLLDEARAVEPDLRVSKRDPYALRYMGVLAFVLAVVFGSILKVATVGDIAGGGGDLAGGPTWEGWIEPPAYTGKPSLYLADIGPGGFNVPANSRLTLRLYGEVGSLTVAETVSGRVDDLSSAAEPSQDFTITKSGTLAIEGPGGQSWDINVIANAPPLIKTDGEVERGLNGEMKLPFHAQDDYGVTSGTMEIALDLAGIDRRFGLRIEPEPRKVITLDLPLPFRGDRTDIREILVENMALHAWATLPVKITLTALDGAGAQGTSTPETITLPGRRFFDPLANALIEQRRALLWNSENGALVSQVLRAVSYRADDAFSSHTAYLKLRVAIRRLEVGFAYSELSPARRDEIAQVLWDIAVQIEDGNLSDALERLRRAQERLSEAMEQGANDEEIAELMEELRQAMQDYMQQLAEQSNPEDSQMSENQDRQEITQDQLQEMMDRIQELMEQGRMDEAQQLLDQLQQMMENMQVTQGQGQQSPGQQAMEGLADTLRQQQELSDETFSDLQEQFGEEGQEGDEGQGEEEGEDGQQGQGGQQGQQGQAGKGGEQGQGQVPGNGQGQGNQSGQQLANRQGDLRNQLGNQSQSMPGTGSNSGDGTGDALGRAGDAMQGAEDALRGDDLAGALDDQAEAMEALREGMRQLAEEMAQEQNREGQQGEASGRANNQNSRDPLGREAGASGQVGTDEQLLQGDDVYRRARELLDEIRRRSSDQKRPEVELDYLKRLLDRF